MTDSTLQAIAITLFVWVIALVSAVIAYKGMKP
ncbi:hypothetical protein UFOVP92_51 [uncultured Caudovirales phage]|uniref:Uncharacterized protein n=1 Tax=uncultured Caudovirales phage TaxID=2100421 RepID=A0A6J5L4T7_9CAUD|nr:hypothetical protein UFOVP92_51 [uncultured Caudovirales phage]